jgi:HPt (histidine-containing phosphotransfer) domain-containing protein
MGRPEANMTTEAGGAISATQFAALVDMVGADMPEVVIDILNTYIEEADALIGALEAAQAKGETAEMLRPAHSLKSSSASVGAMRLSELSAKLEAHARGLDNAVIPGTQIAQIRQEYVRVVEGLEVEKQRLSGG